MPSVTTYNTLLLAVARGGDLRAAQQWLRRMVALTEEPNEVRDDLQRLWGSGFFASPGNHTKRG